MDETGSKQQPIRPENVVHCDSAQPEAQSLFDTTGQVAPLGRKPRVAATLWEEEGTLLFTVDLNNVPVVRREGVWRWWANTQSEN
jgi:hypothetical protein